MSEEKRPVSRPMTEDQTEAGGENPHRRREADAGDFKGGQSDQAYYGDGQLGDKKVGENENAVSTEEGQ